MGVNKPGFWADFASFASVSIGGRCDNVCDNSGAMFNDVAGLALHPARPHLFLNNRGDLTPLSAGPQGHAHGSRILLDSLGEAAYLLS